MFRFRITPQDRVFFDLLEASSEVIIKATNAYGGLVRDYARREEHIARIHEIEREGDCAAMNTFDRLDQTFITPFDRDDIALLARRMDDVVDEIDAAARRMTLYEIPAPTQQMIELVDVLIEVGRLVRLAVGGLRQIKNPVGLHDTLLEIHRNEKLADDIHHQAVADLFHDRGDPLDVIKWKEIYALTEKAVDRCDDIGNIIRSIILKNG